MTDTSMLLTLAASQTGRSRNRTRRERSAFSCNTATATPMRASTFANPHTIGSHHQHLTSIASTPLDGTPGDGLIRFRP